MKAGDGRAIHHVGLGLMGISTFSSPCACAVTAQLCVSLGPPPALLGQQPRSSAGCRSEGEGHRREKTRPWRWQLAVSLPELLLLQEKWMW